MKNLKKLCTLFLAMALVIAQIGIVSAHSGRTDSQGGHRDNKNASGLGYYHYHCGGYSPHLHPNDVCPYSSNSSNSSTVKKKTGTKKTVTSKYYKKSTVKKVQLRLIKRGYKCGRVDGKYDKKVKKAIRRFQSDYSLRVNGKINKKLIKKLRIKI